MGEEEKKPEAVAEEEKKTEEVKKEEEKKEEESKEEATPQPQPPPPPPPPPQEIILKVYMHCEGCARKVRRCLKGFPGVEDVVTDCKSHKVVVKGEKADPLMVLDRVQRKSHRKVELISPIPIPKPPPAEEEKKPEEEEKPKPEEKKEEPEAMIVVLRIHMHCEACAQQMKKLILRMKGVESAESDLKSSQVKVQGVFDPQKLVEFLYKRSGKRGTIVSQEPVKKEEKPEEAKEEPKKKEDNNSKAPTEEEKKEEAPAPATAEEGKAEAEAKAKAEVVPAPAEANPDEMKMMVEAKKLEYLYYPPPRYAMEYYAPAPQIFSDENPNACSVM